jgi:biopolymer transport protein ExbD
LGASTGNDFNSGDDDLSLMSDINVTPFVDVVLVLLVIFMITAPVIMKDTLDIKLPKSTTTDGKKIKSLGVAVTRQGQFLLNGSLSSEDELTLAVKKAIIDNPEIQAIISADKDSLHGSVVRLIDLIKSAGLSKFAIQIEKQQSSSGT